MANERCPIQQEPARSGCGDAGLPSFFRPQDAAAGGDPVRPVAAYGGGRSSSSGEGWGLYRRSDAEITPHLSVAAVCARIPTAIVSLITALEVHDIGTQLGYGVWIAIPHGDRAPTMDSVRLNVTRFSGPSLHYGVVETEFEGVPARITSPARTVVGLLPLPSQGRSRSRAGGLRRGSSGPEGDARRDLESCRGLPRSVAGRTLPLRPGAVISPVRGPRTMPRAALNPVLAGGTEGAGRRDSPTGRECLDRKGERTEIRRHSFTVADVFSDLGCSMIEESPMTDRLSGAGLGSFFRPRDAEAAGISYAQLRRMEGSGTRRTRRVGPVPADGCRDHATPYRRGRSAPGLRKRSCACSRRWRCTTSVRRCRVMSGSRSRTRRASPRSEGYRFASRASARRPLTYGVVDTTFAGVPARITTPGPHRRGLLSVPEQDRTRTRPRGAARRAR